MQLCAQPEPKLAQTTGSQAVIDRVVTVLLYSLAKYRLVEWVQISAAREAATAGAAGRGTLFGGRCPLRAVPAAEEVIGQSGPKPCNQAMGQREHTLSIKMAVLLVLLWLATTAVHIRRIDRFDLPRPSSKIPSGQRKGTNGGGARAGARAGHGHLEHGVGILPFDLISSGYVGHPVHDLLRALVLQLD